jgi:hypothetical protein
MTGTRMVVTEVSTRSPRGSWARPRSTNDAITALEHNGFLSSKVDVGVAFVRAGGLLALRVTIAHGRATLETGPREDGKPVRWRPCAVPLGSEPWQVVREALELLATLDVDTPIRWG